MPTGSENLMMGGAAMDLRTELDGACTVQLRDRLIYSNQVFFDRSELLRSDRSA